MAYIDETREAAGTYERAMNIGILEQKETERANLLVWARMRPSKRFTLADAMKAFGMTKQRTFSRIQELESRRVIARTNDVRDRFTVFEVAQ